jgi:hypothetical protein
MSQNLEKSICSLSGGELYDFDYNLFMEELVLTIMISDKSTLKKYQLKLLEVNDLKIVLEENATMVRIGLFEFNLIKEGDYYHLTFGDHYQFAIKCKMIELIQKDVFEFDGLEWKKRVQAGEVLR